MKKTTFLKTLLMAVGLCVGAGNAWGISTSKIYALAAGKTYTSGQTANVSTGKDGVIASITYGETGGANFAETVAATSGDAYVEGFSAYTTGNGTNGNSAGGTFYTIVPKFAGTLTVAVIINADKGLIVEEDGVTMTGFDGTTNREASKYYGTKDITVKANSSYKIYVSGSKLGFYGFKLVFDDLRNTETYDFATLGNTYANGTMGDGFKWFSFDGPYTLTDDDVNEKDVTDLYKIMAVGNEDKSVIGRYVNGRIAIQKNTGNSGSPWLRNNGNGIQSNGNKITGYLALYGLSAGDDIKITGSEWTLCSGNVSASATGEAVTSLTSGTKYYVLDSNPVLLYYGNYPCIKKIVINTKTDLLSDISATSTVSGADRVLTLSPSYSTADNAVMKSYYTTDGTTPTIASTEVEDNQITISADATVKITGINTTSGFSSNVFSKDVVTGEVVLNCPVITLTGMAETSELYVPTFSISEDNSDKEGNPSATLSATFNGEEVDISSGTFQPSQRGTLIVSATAIGYTSSATEQYVYGAYTCQSTPDFSTIALADLSTTLGGTWVDDGTSRWASWSTTGGKNADLSSNGGGSYAQYKKTDNGTVTVGDWFSVSRNRGSSTLSAVAGYGLGDQSYAASFNILKPVEGAVVEYAIGRNSPSTNYYIMTADDGSKASKNFGFGTAAYVIKYCKYYVPATASKTLTSAGWSTYCSPYILDFSSAIDGLNAAYIVTGGADGVLTKTEVTGAVPAGTGLLLKGTESASLSIPVAATATFSVTANKLVGVTASETLAANGGYVLMTSPSLAFYKNNNAFTLSANSAYLPADFDGGSARISFSLFGNDETTSIGEELRAKGEDLTSAPIFNLQGQRVEKPTKGLFIVNGKKVIVK